MSKFTDEEIREEFKNSFHDWMGWDDNVDLPDVSDGSIQVDGFLSLRQLEMLADLMVRAGKNVELTGDGERSLPASSPRSGRG